MRKILLGLLLAMLPTLAYGQGAGGQQVSCNKTAVGSSGAATTQTVVPVGSQTITVCGFDVTAGAAAGTFQLINGTGATCGTGTITNTGVMSLGVNGVLASTNRQFSTPQGAGLCVVVTGTGPVAWTVYFAQY